MNERNTGEIASLAIEINGINGQSSIAELFTEGSKSTFCYRSLKSGKNINVSDWAYPSNLTLIPRSGLHDGDVM